jgi:hypothetical protein
MPGIGRDRNLRMLRGALTTFRRRCGKPSCRCAGGDPHESPALTFTEGGRTRMVTLPGPPRVRPRRGSVHVVIVCVVVEHHVIEVVIVVRIARRVGRFGLGRVDAARHLPVVRVERGLVERLAGVRGAVFGGGATLGQLRQICTGRDTLSPPCGVHRPQTGPAGPSPWPKVLPSRAAVAITKPGSEPARARCSAARRAISRRVECTENSRTPKAPVGKAP